MEQPKVWNNLVNSWEITLSWDDNKRDGAGANSGAAKSPSGYELSTLSTCWTMFNWIREPYTAWVSCGLITPVAGTKGIQPEKSSKGNIKGKTKSMTMKINGGKKWRDQRRTQPIHDQKLRSKQSLKLYGSNSNYSTKNNNNEGSNKLGSGGDANKLS